ncbi:NB-ARC domain-containing protein [Nostoc linckia]|uniref:NB-ARC domain-containing protein n=1 Tax=Nostoc linckia TaxID=92942 RepID=UPI000BFFE983|nr:NB-ARC domain-containing protein [Nostoc linckia]
MPRQTYGPEPKKRVKRLLEALLCFADGEFEDGDFKIQYDWKDEDSTNPKLTIETTQVTLGLLTEKDKYPDKLTKAQIQQALTLLKDFLKILEDNRTQTKGVDEWHFTLKLWSTDKEKNLKRFDEAWENNRPNKSKKLAANSTQNEGVVTVPQTKLAIFQAPPLPTYFVERPEYSDDLKTRILNGSSADSRTLVITAIHGLGSVGKSTLAAALAYDAEVQSRFCDGILWATLGQQPDVLSLISGWVQALGDYSFKPTSVTATSNHLRTLLYDKAVLLVVDDAWNIENAQAFNVGGLRCQVLVTTREGHIADALAASTYSLDIMKPDQAMELLTKKLRREITGTERHSAENLAKGVGYLPLALELAAAEVAYGTTWDELLGDIQQEVARLTSFDRPEAEEITDEASLKRLSLTASLNLSVKRMPAEKQQHFSWLGVLPEDVNINKMMAATLWQMDKRDAAKMLQYLRNKALLLTGVPLADGMPTYRLHDLFHDLARNLLTEPSVPKRPGDLAGLGLSLADAHAALLEKYRQKTENGLWHTVPNDGYIHQHLVWHLEKAGRVKEIHQLLRKESGSGNNGWYEVREQLAQTGGYITDISRAWELAEANWNESTLGLQCRYALITASLNSLAANLPANLLVALVKNKMWTPEQGLAYALQKPELDEKVKALVKLTNYLPPNLEKLALSKILTAARAIQDEFSRVEALSALADKLPPELLPEALTAAKAIEDEFSRTYALSALADKLPPELLPEALTAAKAIEDEDFRTYFLSALADKLPPELLPEVLTAAKAIEDKDFCTYALSALADKLPPELLPEALAAARAIPYDSSRAKALSALADKLPEVLPEALAAARAIRHDSSRAKALSALVDKLPPELLPEALAAARAIQDEYSRIEALSALANKLPELLPEALAAARAIQDEYSRIEALSALANKLPEILPEALAAARAIPYDSSRAKALSALADKLPEILPEALTAARAIQDEYSHIEALSALADKLPEILPEALTAARTIQDEYSRAEALSALAEKLPEVLPQAFTAAKAIEDDDSRIEALSALAEKLPPELLPEALTAARAIQSEFYRAYALSALAEKLPPELLPEALTAARAIQDEYFRAKALSALADKLPEILPEVLATARAIQDKDSRAKALSALADKLPEILPEALTAARAIQDKDSRAYALSALADKLPPELLPEVLTAAKAIQNEYSRAEALSALAEKLPPKLLPEALTAAKAIEDEFSRTYALSALAEKLPPELLPEALTAARAIQDERYRANALSALAKKLPPELLPEALTAARAIQDKDFRNYALSTLADKLPPEWLPEALTAARAIQDDYYRANALSALADSLLQMPAAELFSLWEDTLHELSLRTRHDLLQDIKALFPVLSALGGEAATVEIACAIVDVGRWWK